MFSTTNTPLRRPLTKAAVAATAAVALAGGIYGAQSASAGSEDKRSVTRAATPNGDTDDGRIVAAEKPRIDERPAPAPAVGRATTPKGDDNGGRIVAAETPGATARSAPAPDEQPR